MAEPIQTVPLGLLAAAMNPAALPHAGLLPAVPITRSAPPSPPPPQRPFAGLFGAQPTGYTPQDVQRVMGEQADFWQRFPITPQWNGGRGIGGIGPAIANFGSGFMSTALPQQQQRTAQENERIRRDAAARASGATTLEDAVAALQGGSPEQSAAALQIRLQSLARAEERRRRLEAAGALVDGISGAPQTAAPATTAPQAPAAQTPPTAPPANDMSQYVDPVAGEPIYDMRGRTAPPDRPVQTEVPLLDRALDGAPLLPPVFPGALGSAARYLFGQPSPSTQATPQSGAPSTTPSTATPATATTPPAAPSSPPVATAETVVQIGDRRIPLSHARALAMRLDAAGMRSEPLEKAIADAAKAAGPDLAAIQPRITGGLQELASLPERYGGDSGVFGSAVGSFQGPEPSWTGNPLGSLARAWGSISSNWATGNNAQAPPAEVRRLIEGATTTLAMVIKPLIRGAAEGPWTDNDQAKLDSIMGNLTSANDVAGYRRELEAVRSRIRANFGIDLPPIAFPGGGQQAPGGGSGQSGPTAPGSYVWTPNGGLQRQ